MKNTKIEISHERQKKEKTDKLTRRRRVMKIITPTEAQKMKETKENFPKFVITKYLI